MRSICVLVVACVLMICISCGKKSETASGTDASQPAQTAIEMPADYSLTGTWTGEYKSKTVTIVFDDPDATGTFQLDGLANSITFEVEKELPSENRINAVIKPEYKFVKEFAPKTLKPGYDTLTLKMKYTGENEFTVHNGLFVQDGKLAKDDGPMTLKKQ